MRPARIRLRMVRGNLQIERFKRQNQLPNSSPAGSRSHRERSRSRLEARTMQADPSRSRADPRNSHGNASNLQLDPSNLQIGRLVLTFSAFPPQKLESMPTGASTGRIVFSQTQRCTQRPVRGGGSGSEHKQSARLLAQPEVKSGKGEFEERSEGHDSSRRAAGEVSGGGELRGWELSAGSAGEE